MRCELPVLLRCCFCFPLRIGLLVWAYLKQIFNVIFLFILILSFYHDYGRIYVATKVVISIIITLLVLDIVFHVVFIASAFSEDYKKMRIFYRYSIFVLCLNVVVMGFFIGLWCFLIFAAPIVLIFKFSIMLPSLFLSMIASILQGYLIILVRSEFMKLKNKSRFEFVNNVTDAKCTATLNFVKGIPVNV